MKRLSTEQAHDPTPEIYRGEGAEEPAQQQAQPEAEPVSARLALFLDRHKFLFGLLLGYILRQLFKLLAMIGQ